MLLSGLYKEIGADGCFTDSEIFGSMHKAAWIRLLSTEVEMYRYCHDREMAYRTQSEMASQRFHVL